LFGTAYPCISCGKIEMKRGDYKEGKTKTRSNRRLQMEPKPD
jgi:hypothetical protein